MSKYKKQLDQLIIEAKTELQELIDTHGIKSKHNSGKCLKVSEDFMINLEGGRYLTKISKGTLMDNRGYVYGHDAITAEALFCVLDDLIEKNKDVTEQKV